MELLKNKIETYIAQIKAIQPTTLEELEQYRIQYLGTKGIVKELLASMKGVPGPQKKKRV